VGTGGGASVMPRTTPPAPPGGVFFNLPSDVPPGVAGGMTLESEGGLGRAGLTQAGFWHHLGTRTPH
jgi:hypothetical protein